MKNRIYISLLFIVLAGVLSAQPSTKKYYEKGLKALENANYSGALSYLSDALHNEPQNPDYLYAYARAAKEQFAYKEAEQKFEFLIDSLDNTSYPNASLYLANIKQTLGKYDEAAKYYDLYLSEYEGDNPNNTALAKLGKESSEWALSNPLLKRDDVELTQLGSNINTGYSEHGAVVHEDNLYFSSLRFEKSKDSFIPNRKVSKILKEDEIQSDVLGRKDNFNNDKMLTSSMSYSPDGAMMIYSLCDYDDGAKIRCDLYCRTISDDGNWGEETKLPESINDPNATTTQASFGSQTSGITVVYFASDRSGGKGGMDIWYTSFDEEMNFSAPKNIMAINTAGDEVTPHFQRNENSLYFSSNNLVGYGGFDIYKSKLSGSTFGEVVNAGPELNSSFNDIYYFMDEKNNTAYFSSNRVGSMYLEDKFETCCYDIYKLDYGQCILDLELLVFDAESKEALNGALVVIEKVGAEEDPIEIENFDGNDFLLPVECGVNYDVTAYKKGYKSASVTVLAQAEGDKGKISRSLYLEPEAIALIVSTFDQNTREALYGCTVSLYSVDPMGEKLLATLTEADMHQFIFDAEAGAKYKIMATKGGYTSAVEMITIPNDALGEIRKDVYLGKSNVELEVLTFERATREALFGTNVRLVDVTAGNVEIATVSNPTSHKYDFHVEAGHSYRVIASKAGYDVETLNFTILSGATGKIRKEAYLGRIAKVETLAELIPLKLYFDNDHPNPRTTRTTSTKNYTSTYDAYYSRKQVFKDKYSSKFASNMKSNAMYEIDQFFQNEVKGGHDRISIFMETLNRILQRGEKITLYLRGYASPLAKSDYNLNLGKRRVDSIRKEFREYSNGILMQYINSGQLTLTERSFGENSAPTGISDDPSSPSNSIYSPEASRERRIEIDEIQTIDN